VPAPTQLLRGWEAGIAIPICYNRLPIGEVGMDENKLEKLARLSGKATSKALDALSRHGFDLRGKLATPISRVPRKVSPEKPKSDDR